LLTQQTKDDWPNYIFGPRALSGGRVIQANRAYDCMELAAKCSSRWMDRRAHVQHAIVDYKPHGASGTDPAYGFVATTRPKPCAENGEVEG